MIGKEILEKKPVTLLEVKDIIKKSASEDRELTYEQDLSQKYADKFTKVKKTDAKKMLKEMLDEGIPEEMAVKVIDILPDTEEKVELLKPRGVDVTPAMVKKALDVSKKYK